MKNSPFDQLEPERRQERKELKLDADPRLEGIIKNFNGFKPYEFASYDGIYR